MASFGSFCLEWDITKRLLSMIMSIALYYTHVPACDLPLFIQIKALRVLNFRPSPFCHSKTKMPSNTDKSQYQERETRYQIVPAFCTIEALNMRKAIEKYNALPENERYPSNRVKFILPQHVDRGPYVQAQKSVNYTDKNDST